MTLFAQYVAVGAIVVAALGYLVWQLNRRLFGSSPAEDSACGTCDKCPGCAPARLGAARQPVGRYSGQGDRPQRGASPTASAPRRADRRS
jgi:hypothetical protein